MNAAPVLALAVLVLLAGCRERHAPPSSAQGAARPLAGKLVLAREAPEDGTWRMAARDHASTRYSRLDEITADNVKGLKVAWSWSSGLTRGHEAAPVVVGDRMFVVTPFPNRLVALDLRDGKVIWQYDPAPDPSAQGIACCDLVNRGAAYDGGRLFYVTLDDHVVAVDAASGKELWKTKVGNIQIGESMTMAPIVVKGKVLVGNSGGEFGVRGWLTALDAATGKIAWRAWSTGPDADVLIGPAFRPFYAHDRGKDLGVATWPPERWKIGGGTIWGWLSYDPELDLVYAGTGNPGTWNPEQRPGDNKWTEGVFARRPETGEAIWFYQWSPHGAFDHDGVNENVLVDLEASGGGARRKLLLHPDRNGYLYVLDRATGEVLSADPYAPITTSERVDLESGRLVEVPEKQPGYDRLVRGACPPAPGAKDWQPSSFSPRTGYLYVPHQNMCQDVEGYEANYIAGTPYVGANVRMYAAPGHALGELAAWDPLARKKAWAIPEEFPVWSGTLATAGDVVFYGTMDGWFKAVHARTGAELWRFKAESGVIGQPVTYRGPGGKQYVAVFAGVGGWAGAIVSAGLDARDPTAGNGWANAVRELPNRTRPGGRLYVFSLP
jgi:lanthanide-dependent methanol dehydrogenase